MDLVRHVRRELQRERVVASGDTVVCAVSGGPDSMALLHIMHRLAEEEGWRVAAAHVNHGFRGVESDREADVVQAFARRLGVVCESVKLDVPGYAQAERLNAQAAARELRYRFLRDTARRIGACAVVLAHHQDDQAETVLLNLTAGAALRGLSGMAPVREEDGLKLVRPLLRIEKTALLAYVAREDIPYCEDSSNRSRKYARNRMRLDVLPLLAEMNPHVSGTLGRMADVLREEDAYMTEQATAKFRSIVRRGDGYCTADRGVVLAEPLALQRRLIHLILNYVAGDNRFAEFVGIESIRNAIAAGSPPSLSLDIGGGITFTRTYERLLWCKENSEASSSLEAGSTRYRYLWDYVADPRLVVQEARATLIAEMTDRRAALSMLAAARGRQDRNVAVFDADSLGMPLVVRARQPGDRMVLPGVEGARKVKDIFIDAKVDPAWRDCVPLLADASGAIVWIPGLRRADGALVDHDTARAVIVRFEPDPDMNSLNGLPDGFIR